MSAWQSLTLGDILERVKRPVKLIPETEYETLGIRWYGDGCFVKAPQFGNDIAAATLFALEVDDVVYSRLFAWKGSFGVVTPRVADAVASNEFPTYRATEAMLPAFFTAWAGRPALWDYVEAISSGSTANSRLRLSEDDFLSLSLDLPPLDEQRRIVLAVEHIDSRIRAAIEYEATSKRLLAAAVESMLATQRGWTVLPPGWSLARLGDIADVRSGITKGRRTKAQLQPHPFLRAANVQNGYLDLDEIKSIEVSEVEIGRFELEVGDLLLVEGSGSPDRLGRGWLWEGQLPSCLHQNHVFRARPDQTVVDPLFLAYAVGAAPARAHFLDAAKTTSGLATINRAQTCELPVPLPPLVEQTRIAAALDTLRTNQLAATRLVEASRALRGAVVHQLVAERKPDSIGVDRNALVQASG